MKVSIFFYIILFISTISWSQMDNEVAKKRIDSLIDVAIFIEYSDHEKSMSLIEETIQKSNEIGYELGVANSILQKGYLLEDIGDFDNALLLYDSVLTFYTKMDNIRGLVKVKNALGVLLNYQGKHEKALIYLQESYNHAEEINHVSGIATALGNMGLVQSSNKNYDEALNYYNQALKIKIELNDSLGIAIDQMNIGDTYFALEEYDKSLKYYYESIEMSRKIDDKIGIAYCLTSIGFIQYKKELFNEALDNFQFAIDIQKSINDKNGLANSYKALGDIYATLNLIDKALLALNEGLKIASELKLSLLEQDIYRILSGVYEKEKKFEKALYYHQLHTSLKDSIFNLEKNQQLAEIEGKYHTKLQKKEIKKQEVKLSEKDAQLDIIIQEENFILNISTIIIITVLIIAGVIFFYFNKKRKLANELEKLSIVAREIENTVIIANQDGEIEWINESYTRRIGFDLKAFKDKFGKYIANSSDSPQIHESVAKCKREKKSVKYALEMENKHGEKHWIQTTLTPILDKNGEIHKFILIDSDITDIKIAEGKMAQQRDELIQKNKLITESIDYAKRIQSALLPSQQKLTTSFEEHFIFYHPKDIVSGDFYWLNKKSNTTLFAAADCTGHGVPGALMSIIGMNSLNSIVEKTNEPKEVLEALSDQIQEKLAHQDHSEQLKDGIDIAFCTFKAEIKDNSIGTLQFSGAHNPLYLIRNNELHEYKSNRVHIGANRRAGTFFSQENIPIQKGDVIYLFTDGFADQKGGEKGRKFYYGPFRQFLLDIHSKPMKTQKQMLTDKIMTWKDNQEQIDDMLIWGIKF